MVLVVAVVAVVGATRLLDDDDAHRADPGPVHVHALGLDPTSSSLFIATHTGLFRLPPDRERPQRVGDGYQDTMGFTVVGPDLFLASGHPDARDDLPPLLGLLESRDTGETWESVSLLGEVDFHALRVRGGEIVGYDATSGRILISQDGGRTWSERRPPERLDDLVVHPSSAGVLVASGERRVLVSRNRGTTWTERKRAGGLLAWPRRDRLYLVDKTGRLWISPDEGARWQRRGHIGGGPAALLAVGAHTLYVATHDGAIKRSTDGGANWIVRSRP